MFVVLHRQELRSMKGGCYGPSHTHPSTLKILSRQLLPYSTYIFNIIQRYIYLYYSIHIIWIKKRRGEKKKKKIRERKNEEKMRPPKSKKGFSRKPSKNPPPQPRDGKKDKKTSSAEPQPQSTPSSDTKDDDLFSDTIPITLQQLLLNVFKYALLYSHVAGSASGSGRGRGSGGMVGGHGVIVPTDTADTAETATATAEAEAEAETETETAEETLNTKQLIQTIKSHLYNRDFDSAFTDADDDLLRAYALRWSASRALGYAGLFRGLLGLFWGDSTGGGDVTSARGGGEATAGEPAARQTHVLCLGGGAGAEIVALAAAMRDLVDGGSSAGESLAVTAVDIADWSGVVRRLDSAARSDAVPSGRSHPAPLTRETTSGQQQEKKDSDFQVRFRRADVLSMPDEELKSLLYFNNNDDDNNLSLDSLSLDPTTQKEKTPTIITLMFTLNELFSTSMAKATALLLRITDLVHAGSLLLVVDSPGSYSTLRLASGGGGGGGGGGGEAPERRYPMKFLLDHALLSVAGGKWERVYSRDSRWWRREAGRLSYEVGEGAGLEDMRFQVHLYRRV